LRGAGFRNYIQATGWGKPMAACDDKTLRIALRKITDERHVLEVTRGDGRTDSVECETRSYLVHDLLHYAVESEAGLRGGFWGSLAAGKTLAQMNDRTPGTGMADGAGEMGAIEQIVGALHGTTKGRRAGDVVAGVRRFNDSIGVPTPSWLTEAFVERVQERMHHLQGRWRATPRGGRMDLSFPPGR
jgi:hypothetical protein